MLHCSTNYLLMHIVWVLPDGQSKPELFLMSLPTIVFCVKLWADQCRDSWWLLKESWRLVAQMEKFSTFLGWSFHTWFSQGLSNYLFHCKARTLLSRKLLQLEIWLLNIDQMWTLTSFTVGLLTKDLTAKPVLPRVRRPPTKPGDNTASVHVFPNPASFFQKAVFWSTWSFYQ